MNEQVPLPTSGAATLSPAERRILLQEIGRISLTLGRDQSATPDSAVPVSPESVLDPMTTTSPLERLRLLVTLWQEMLSPLSALMRRPDSLLQQEAVQVSLPRAQGGPELAQKVARTPGGQAAWSEAQRFQEEASSPAPPSTSPARTLSERKPRSTTATLANRFVVSLLLAIAQEAEALARLAAFCGERQEAEQISRVALAAERWRKHPLLHTLPALSTQEWQTLPGINALRAAPPYRILFSAWRKLNAGLRFDWSGSPLLSLPPLEPWNLYEIWCYLYVAGALREAGWLCVGGDALRWEANGLRLVLATGQASRLVFAPGASPVPTAQVAQRRKRSTETLELFYQPLFLSANRRHASLPAPDLSTGEETETGFASLTHAMQPDIGLCRQKRWFLLDPKFRTYAEPGAEQEDVDKMHTYRDAIVQRGSLRRTVAAAWCLFPGESAGEPPPLQVAVRAYPSATPERPFGSAGIGALRLRPGDPTSAAWLSLLIADWLNNRQPPT